jgi:hypothetical protein
MNPAIKYEHIADSLRFWLGETQRSALLVGLLFCRPSTQMARNEILPAVFDFHYASDVQTQFYFAGYGQVERPGSNAIFPAAQTGAPPFEFDAKGFNDFVTLIELKTKWRYSGGTDLILADGRYDPARATGYVDFSSAMSLTLEFVKGATVYPEIGMFFQQIFTFAKDYEGENPTFALSDALGRAALKNIASSLALKFVPGETKEGAVRGLQFAAQDLRKSKLERG